MNPKDRKLHWERDDLDRYQSPKKFLKWLFVFILLYGLSYVLLFKTFGERVVYQEHTFQNNVLISSYDLSTTGLPFYAGEFVERIIYQVYCLALNLDRQKVEVSIAKKQRLQNLYNQHASIYCKSGFEWILDINDEYIYGFENYYLLMGKDFYIELDSTIE